LTPHPGPIDVQTHYIPPAVVEALERRTSWPNIINGPDGGDRLMVYGDDAIYPLTPDMVDLDTKIEVMDKNGIGMSVLSTNIPGLDWFDESEVEAIARDTNDQLAEEVKRRPDRFAALAALPLARPEAAAAELERAVAMGHSGAMVYSNVAGRTLDEEAFRPVFETAEKLDVPILIHPTYPLSASTVDAYALVSVFGYMFDTATAAMRLILSGIYNRQPNLKLILPHTGSVVPWLAGRLDHEGYKYHPEGFGQLDDKPSEYIKRLYVDVVSGYPLSVRYVLDYLGADHVMYGSDHPFWDPAWTNEVLAQVDMTDEERQLMETGTARRILRIGDGE
jgi:predicted TIM-barrel fold metal-dependent hydrolase